MPTEKDGPVSDAALEQALKDELEQVEGEAIPERLGDLARTLQERLDATNGGGNED